MSDSHPLTPRRNGLLTGIFWFGVLATLTVALTAAAIFFFTTRVTAEIESLARHVSDKFEKAFQVRPEVRVDGLIILQGTVPILEIATAEKSLMVRHRWSQTWLYSTKVLEIEAPFTAKAGFPIREPLRVRIDPHTKVLSADLPRPQILSVEMGEVKILTDEDGLWNKLTPGDREEAFRALRKQADQQFASSNLLQLAGLEARKRLESVLQAETPGQAKPPKP